MVCRPTHSLTWQRIINSCPSFDFGLTFNTSTLVLNDKIVIIVKVSMGICRDWTVARTRSKPDQIYVYIYVCLPSIMVSEFKRNVRVNNYPYQFVVRYCFSKTLVNAFKTNILWLSILSRTLVLSYGFGINEVRSIIILLRIDNTCTSHTEINKWIIEIFLLAQSQKKKPRVEARVGCPRLNLISNYIFGNRENKLRTSVSYNFNYSSDIVLLRVLFALRR